MYMMESRAGHSTVVSIRIPETVLRVKGTRQGVSRYVGREHMSDAVCGRDCCC